VEHGQILAALEARDPDAAEQGMRSHLFSVLHDLEQSGVQRHDDNENE
jgi:DNA-binding FadR family transcriptional regulator